MKHKGKGVAWYDNKRSDGEKWFASYYPGVSPCEHRLTVRHDELTKENLYYGDNDSNGEMKCCDGDVFERRTEGWQTGMGFLRFIRLNETHSHCVAVIGSDLEFYIPCTKKYYDKI